jgi:hypothetical protein
MADKPEVTQEMIEAYQRQQAEAEQQRRHALIRELAALAQERGYQIIAAPQIAGDGRLVAVWGVQVLE